MMSWEPRLDLWSLNGNFSVVNKRAIKNSRAHRKKKNRLNHHHQHVSFSHKEKSKQQPPCDDFSNFTFIFHTSES